MKRFIFIFLGAFFLGTLAACVQRPVLVPESGGETALASAAGVSIAASPDAWAGVPSDLEDYVTPIALDIHNGSKQTVRVRWQDFGLKNDRGLRFIANNPWRVQYHMARLASNNAYWGVYPGWGVGFGPRWYRGWRWGWTWVPSMSSYYSDTHLFEDIGRYGIAEGSLEPDGQMAGFVYFPLATKDTNHLQLDWVIKAEADNRELGQVSIRFNVVR